MICDICKSPARPEDAFCSQCGATLPKPTVAVQPSFDNSALLDTLQKIKVEIDNTVLESKTDILNKLESLNCTQAQNLPDVNNLENSIEILQTLKTIEQKIGYQEGLQQNSVDNIKELIVQAYSQLEYKPNNIDQKVETIGQQITEVKDDINAKISELNLKLATMQECIDNQSNQSKTSSDDLVLTFGAIDQKINSLNTNSAADPSKAVLEYIDAKINSLNSTTSSDSQAVLEYMDANLENNYNKVNSNFAVLRSNQEKLLVGQKNILSKVSVLDNNQSSKTSIGWAFLSLFLPLIGAILYLCYTNTKPNRAKYLGVGLFICILLLLLIIVTVIIIVLNNNSWILDQIQWSSFV